MDKSCIIDLQGRKQMANKFAELLGCAAGDFPIKYLGLPLKDAKLKREDWRPILSKLDGTLAGWKGNLLSKAGRLILVNAVLTSISAYYSSVFRLPQWVIKEIDWRRRCFLWGRQHGKNSNFNPVNWRTVTLKKENGGLGVLDINTHNNAMLAKWLWKIILGDQSTWARVVRWKYYRRKNWYEERNMSKWTDTWRAITKLRDIFFFSLEYDVGGGEDIQFWLEPWKDFRPLALAHKEVYRAAANPKIQLIEVVVQEDGVLRGWSVSLLEEVSEEAKTSLLADLEGIRISTGPKQVKWRWCADGVFSVKSLYTILQETGIRDETANLIWNVRVPLKLNIFHWLMRKDKLHTKMRLICKGVMVDEACILCGKDVETRDHLFFVCSFTCIGWRIFLEQLNSPFFSLDYTPWAARDKKKIKLAKLRMLVVWHWCVWGERNRRCFKDENKAINAVAAQAVSLFIFFTTHLQP